MSCDATGSGVSRNWPGTIWVESGEVVRRLEDRFSNRPMQGPEPVHLLFHYDAQKDDAAWRKLISSRSSQVSILAQFETTGRPESRFGHLGSFSHELTIVDVLRPAAVDSTR